MKSCELCKFPARLYCESDQASLCWDCDAKVHFANFLVARHSRSLLCHVCQSPTAWSACGSKLGQTISVCESCADGGRREEESEGCNVDETDTEDEYEDEDEDEDEDEEEDDDEEEDGDNQVVPLSSTLSPPAASSSSSEESSCRSPNGDRDVSLKRMRENDSHLISDQDDVDSPPSAAEAARSGGEGASAFVDLTRPMKSRRIEPNESVRVRHGSLGSTAAAVTSGNKVSAAIVGICKLSKSPRAVDFDYSESS